MLRKRGLVMVAVQVVPLEGYELRAMGGDEWLVMRSDDSTRNTIVDTHTVAWVLQELHGGALGDGFNQGYESMWTIGEIDEP